MSARPKQPPEPAEQAEKTARDDDPHGVGHADKAAEHEATGVPTDDRHQTDTAAGR